MRNFLSQATSSFLERSTSIKDLRGRHNPASCAHCYLSDRPLTALESQPFFILCVAWWAVSTSSPTLSQRRVGIPACCQMETAPHNFPVGQSLARAQSLVGLRRQSHISVRPSVCCILHVACRSTWKAVFIAVILPFIAVTLSRRTSHCMIPVFQGGSSR